MTKKAATDEVLGELHAKVATVMTRVLDKAADALDKEPAEDELPYEINPALLGAVTKFLKDNEITADVSGVKELTSTKERLKEKAKRRREKLNRRDDMVILEDLPLTAEAE